MEKPKVVIDYNSGKEGADLSDAYLTSYCSTRKRLKKYYQKHFHHWIHVCCLNWFLLKKNSISRIEFQVKLTENLISKHITKDRLFGRPPKTAPPTSLSLLYCCHQK
jgi:hypothetical protein